MWLSKVNVYCKYNVEREIVVVKKKREICNPKFQKEKKMVMNEMKMLKKKNSFTMTWSTKNQYEISLGGCLISLRKFLCMSEYSEM